MKQSSLDLNLSTKKTRKQELLVQMDRVVPWAALIDVIAPYYPEGKNGRPPFALETMLRIHCMQQWFTLSDLAMEEALFDTLSRDSCSSTRGARTSKIPPTLLHPSRRPRQFSYVRPKQASNSLNRPLQFIASMFVMQAVVGRGTPFNSRYLARTCALHSSGVQIRMGHGPRRRYRYPLRTCSAYG